MLVILIAEVGLRLSTPDPDGRSWAPPAAQLHFSAVMWIEMVGGNAVMAHCVSPVPQGSGLRIRH